MTVPLPNILLVDDVEANLTAVEAVLAHVPCELLRARSGNEALRTLLRKEVALILLDVQMPEMDGFEVASHLNSNPHTKDIPIIFLTAIHQAEASALRGYGTGAVDYLVKPFNPQVLRSKVQVFLDLYTQKRELSAALEAQRKTLKELESSNEALRHFTQAASHDLGAPLRTIDGFLLALDEEVGASLSPGAKRYVDRSRDAAQRMQSLLESLLAYAALRKPSQMGIVSCSVIVERVCADLARRISASEAEIQVGPLPDVHGDEARLYQVFLNLISNALKFQRQGTRPVIRIRSTPERDHLFRIEVEDNGIGIPKEFSDSVFGAFKRLHSQDKYAGSGLGLKIAHEVVAQHGGRLWVESEPDRGSRFYFTLRAPDAPVVEI